MQITKTPRVLLVKPSNKVYVVASAFTNLVHINKLQPFLVIKGVFEY